jgi:hypothetical protein
MTSHGAFYPIPEKQKRISGNTPKRSQNLAGFQEKDRYVGVGEK